MWSSVSVWAGVLRFQEEVRGGMGGAGASISEKLALQVFSGDKAIQFSLSSALKSS